MLVAIAVPAAAASIQWPDGWSRERPVGSGITFYGHRSAVADDHHLWVLTVGGEGVELALNARRIDIATGLGTVSVTLPITHLLRGHDFYATAEGAIVTWMERHEGVASTLHLALLSRTGQLVAQRVLWRSEALAESPAIALDEKGKVYVAFSAAVQGHHAVHLVSVALEDGGTPALYRLTAPDQLATLPAIAVAGGRLHLVYHRHTVVDVRAFYRLYRLPEVELLTVTDLGGVPEGFRQSPTLLAEDDGSVSVISQRMTARQGRVTAGGPVYGTLREGKWEEPLNPMVAIPGQMGAVRGTRGVDGRVLVTGLARTGRTWQVRAILRDAQGNPVRAGFATMVRGTALDPRPLLVGDTGVVSFFSYDRTGVARLYYVHTAAPVGRTLAFRIGLDPRSPWSDAIFKYGTLSMGAMLAAFGASGAIALSLAVIWILSRLGAFSSSGKRSAYLRYGIQFGLIAYMKQPGSLLYYGAVVIPGWAAVMSWTAAAAVALAVIHASDLAPDDYLTLTFSGLLFVAADAFTSMFILGVGRW
jgi:hypothetical protein